MLVAIRSDGVVNKNMDQLKKEALIALKNDEVWFIKCVSPGEKNA